MSTPASPPGRGTAFDFVGSICMNKCHWISSAMVQRSICTRRYYEAAAQNATDHVMVKRCARWSDVICCKNSVHQRGTQPHQHSYSLNVTTELFGEGARDESACLQRMNAPNLWESNFQMHVKVSQSAGMRISEYHNLQEIKIFKYPTCINTPCTRVSICRSVY